MLLTGSNLLTIMCCHSSGVKRMLGLKRPSNSCGLMSGVSIGQEWSQTHHRASHSQEQKCLEVILWLVTHAFRLQNLRRPFCMPRETEIIATDEVLVSSQSRGINERETGSHLPDIS